MEVRPTDSRSPHLWVI